MHTSAVHNAPANISRKNNKISPSTCIPNPVVSSSDNKSRRQANYFHPDFCLPAASQDQSLSQQGGCMRKYRFHPGYASRRTLHACVLRTLAQNRVEHKYPRQVSPGIITSASMCTVTYVTRERSRRTTSRVHVSALVLELAYERCCALISRALPGLPEVGIILLPNYSAWPPIMRPQR